MDRMEEEEEKKGDTLKLMRDTEELEKSRNEAKTVKQTLRSVCCFQTWCAEKNLAIDFKSISKMKPNQSLRQCYVTVRNGKGERYEHAGLNRYVSDLPISHSWCLMKDPTITKQQRFCWSGKKNFTEEDAPKQLHS